MKEHQSTRGADPELVALEQSLHASFTPWVAAHREKNPEIDDLGFDPEKYPFQRIDSFVEPVVMPTVPEILFFAGLRYKVAQSMGRNVLQSVFADPFVKSIREAPAFEGEDVSIPEAIENYINNGKRVVLVADHNRSKDVAEDLGAVIAAIGKTAYLPNFVLVTGKNISRQNRNGKPVVKSVARFCNLGWVMQDTGNTRTYSVPEEAAQYINTGGMRGIVRLLHHGGLAAMALHGTGTTVKKRLERGKTKTLSLTIPQMSDKAPDFLSHFDAVLPMNSWVDPNTKEVRWRVGHIIPIEKQAELPDGLDRKERHKLRQLHRKMFADQVQIDLASGLAELANAPVVYESLVPKDEKIIIRPGSN